MYYTYFIYVTTLYLAVVELTIYMCTFHSLQTLLQHTPSKYSFVCQSSAQGMSPSSLATGDAEFDLAFFAPLALATVSWSPLNSTLWKVACFTLAVAAMPGMTTCFAGILHCRNILV